MGCRLERKKERAMKKELVQQVNSYVANLGVVYIKTHNLHWNVFDALWHF